MKSSAEHAPPQKKEEKKGKLECCSIAVVSNDVYVCGFDIRHDSRG